MSVKPVSTWVKAVEANMVIFMHMTLLDWDDNLAMAFGDTVAVTPEWSYQAEAETMFRLLSS